MKFFQNILSRGPLILALTLILTFTGCVDMAEPSLVPDNTSDNQVFILNLSVVTSSNTPTRADHNDDYEEEGTEAENYIDIDNNDMRIILFTKAGDFIMELTDLHWEKSGTSSQQVYKMEEKQIPLPLVTEEQRALVEDIRTNGIQVMAIANTRNSGATTTQWTDPNLNLKSIWETGNNFNFRYNPGTNSITWQPDVMTTPKKLIPMFGILSVTFREYGFGISKSYGTINMQRAVAKIEVIDEIPDPSFYVTGVTMTDYNSRGRVIPNLITNPGWNEIGSQVGVSSLPRDPEHKNQHLTLVKLPGEKKWIGYVPEMALTKPNTNGSLPSSRTHLDVSILSGIEETFPLHFAYYADKTTPTIPDESWNHILRNHIYRFFIKNVGVTTKIELHVVPWTLDDDEEWDYTDHVTIGQMLEWKTDSYESLDDESGRLLLWIDENKMLEGSFIIKTPINGRWYARLTPLDDARPNAVTFVDIYGNSMEPSHGDPPVCLEATGIIEEKTPAYIRIMPTNFGNDDMSAFKLEFFVENLGVWMNVPMVADGKSYQYYTIVRKANKII